MKMGTEKYNRKAEWIDILKKELQGPLEDPEVEIHLKFRVTLKKYRIGKRQAMMAYKDSGLKNSRPSTTD